MLKPIRGRVHLFGDNIDTDQIYPGRYIELTEPEDIKQHAMEGVDPGFADSVQRGDIIVAGTNFGCGSSREHAVITLKSSGVSAVVAKSFARIFYRNAINQGLTVVEVPSLSHENLSAGDMLMVNIEMGVVTSGAGEEWSFTPLPVNIIEILEAGGVFKFYNRLPKP
ncbi:3-isopropylmalate dehydratase small subunit [Candidatus Bathyarchaeota archaeon]|nr:3-isopropylmalate dehydratase small subunit [Candidatus Bathyarchaeota archaeon]